MPIKKGIPHASGDEPLWGLRKPLALSVYPTRVGMNRNRAARQEKTIGIPHASGDEPVASMVSSPFWYVYPTRVGMNRRTLES